MSRSFTFPSHLPLSFTRSGILTITCFLMLSHMTAFGEDLPFQIYCPPDTSVDCDAELWDLSIYGNAYYHGYNGYESAGDPISEEYNLNNCGTGTIVRTWVAYDYNNHPHYCSQTIYVGGSGNIYIHWPPNYTIEDCDPWTDPDDLPPPYDKPVVDDSYAQCSQIMIGYEDQVFDINPGCKKILRKWTVIDWCQYDPNDWYPTGEWTHTQTIKIVPSSPPMITCPSDVTVSADGSCDGAYVHIPKATGSSSCGGDVSITNHSPYADNSGADASGFYPLGTTEVVFKVANDCGGYSYTSCSMSVTVRDLKAPTPICYYGISVSLMPMGDGAALDLRPDFFDKGSFDNCTPPEQLVFDIEPKRVTCADLGQIPVKVFVTDKSGNSAHCNTVVVVQDNQGACPPTNGLIQGAVYTPDGSVLDKVKVMLDGADQFDMTGTDGGYSFESVPYGGSYTVRPEPMTDNDDGVTSMDLIVLLKHILGIQPITDPYLLIAGDIDYSGHVSVNDLLELKDFILQGHFGLEMETTWRFIDEEYDFESEEDPLNSLFPENYPIGQFSSDMTGVNFIGVKVGDLSGDMNMPGLNGGAQRSIQEMSLVARVSQPTYRAGDEIEVQIAGDEVEDMLAHAMQFTLSFDPSSVEFIEISSLDLPEMDDSFVNIRGAARGQIAALWFGDQPVQMNQTIMSIRFRALRDMRSDELLELNSTLTRSLAYAPDGTEYELNIRDEVRIEPALTEAHPSGLELYEAFPNPFTSMTNLPFRVDEDGVAAIEVFNANGQLVRSLQTAVSRGRNVVELSDIQEEGMLIVRVTAGGSTQTQRIVSLKRE